jgi:hypothetical protein
MGGFEVVVEVEANRLLLRHTLSRHSPLFIRPSPTPHQKAAIIGVSEATRERFFKILIGDLVNRRVDTS